MQESATLLWQLYGLCLNEGRVLHGEEVLGKEGALGEGGPAQGRSTRCPSLCLEGSWQLAQSEESAAMLSFVSECEV